MVDCIEHFSDSLLVFEGTALQIAGPLPETLQALRMRPVFHTPAKSANGLSGMGKMSNLPTGLASGPRALRVRASRAYLAPEETGRMNWPRIA